MSDDKNAWLISTPCSNFISVVTLFKMQVTWIPVHVRDCWCNGDLPAACSLPRILIPPLPCPQLTVLWYQFYPHGPYDNAVTGNEERGGAAGGGSVRDCAFFLLLPEGGSCVSRLCPQPSFHFLRTPLPFCTVLYSRTPTWEMFKMAWALVLFFNVD